MAIDAATPWPSVSPVFRYSALRLYYRLHGVNDPEERSVDYRTFVEVCKGRHVQVGHPIEYDFARTVSAAGATVDFNTPTTVVTALAGSSYGHSGA